MVNEVGGPDTDKPGQASADMGSIPGEDMISGGLFNTLHVVGTVEIAPGFRVSVIGRWPCGIHRWTTRILLGWRWTKR